MQRYLETALAKATHKRTWFDEGGDGYDWLQRNEKTTNKVSHGAVAGWGLDGWDLGGWPLVVIMHTVRHEPAKGGRFALTERVEGDCTQYVFATEEDLTKATDAVARWWWSRDPERHGPDVVKVLAETSEDQELPERFRGRFSWARLDRSKANA